MLPVEQLKTIPLFAELNEEELAHLAPLFHRARYQHGDLLARQGEAGDAFFVLEHGTLRVLDASDGQEEQVHAYLTAPAFIGETSLISGCSWDASIEVVSEQADLFVLTRQEFELLQSRHPQMQGRLAMSQPVQATAAEQVFPGLSDDEVVLVNTRRHWYALLARLVRPVFISLVLFAAWAFVQQFGPRLTAWAGDTIVPAASLGLFILALLVLFGGIAWEALDWSNDYYVVTNKRVIHIEKTIFLFDEREEAPIEMITNVVELSRGLAPRIFGFVDLRVETAGRQVEINFTFAPRSAQIHHTIFEQMSRTRDHAAIEQRERMRAGIRQQLMKKLAPDTAASADRDASASSAAFTLETPRERPVQNVRYTSLGKFLGSVFALRVDEPHQVTWHKHWFVLVDRVDEPLVAMAVLLMVLGVHASGLVPLRVAALAGDVFLGQMLLTAGWMMLFVLALFWLWYQYEDWNNDLYRVTDDRVIDVERSPFGFSERSVETTLDRVQDISYVQRGPVQVVFNFGDILIETAGAGRFVFYDIENPRAATQEIFRRRDAHRVARQSVEVQQGHSEFLDWFTEYHQLLRERGEMNSPIVPPAAETTPSSESPDETV